MENANAKLLPDVLEYLGRKPDLSDTIENLCTKLNTSLGSEHGSFENLCDMVDRAVAVGQDLGLLNASNGTVRIPFNLRPKGRAAISPDIDKLIDMANKQPPLGAGIPAPSPPPENKDKSNKPKTTKPETKARAVKQKPSKNKKPVIQETSQASLVSSDDGSYTIDHTESCLLRRAVRGRPRKLSRPVLRSRGRPSKPRKRGGRALRGNAQRRKR